MARAAKIARPVAGIDADEAEALGQAALTLQSFARVENAEAVACAVISTWIIERMKRVAGRRLTGNVVFNLNDAKLRGMVEAALPKIAEALATSGFDFTRSFNELDRDGAANLFLAGCVAHREAAIAVGESPDFPFDDPIPFGEEAAA